MILPVSNILPIIFMFADEFAQFETDVSEISR